jgi:FemAB-related protein (PEP-CTERM system-associated)
VTDTLVLQRKEQIVPKVNPHEISVVLFEPSREKDWNAFIEASSKAVFAHHLGWKRVVEETFGHQPFYLMAYRQNQVVGILPLFLIKSIFFENYLVTGPYLTFGGMISIDEHTASALVKRATQIARETKASYIEVRNDQVYPQLPFTKDFYYTLILDLSSGEEKIWNAKVKPATRRNVRKAQQSGLEIVEGKEFIDQFIQINAVNMHRLGSPAHGQRFFYNILRFFPNASLLMVRHQQELVGGTLLVSFKDTMLMPWVGSLEKYFELRPNNLIYWGAIQLAIRQGFRFFDFGRSKFDSGTFRFKAQYGAEPVPLFYQYQLTRTRRMPDVDPDAPQYRKLIEIWKRLPRPAANLIGPLIIRGIA